MRQKTIKGLAVATMLLVVMISPARAEPERRVALIIGNSAYQNASPLKNPVADAKLMAETLKSVGFQIVGGKPLLDGDRPAMEKAIRAFGEALRSGAVGLFYYSGHGIQIKDQNYLIPVNANVSNESDVKYELVDAGFVLDEMANAGSRLNIVILDACRNNPFGGRGLRTVSSGLAQVTAPAGTVISYATQPGQVASDGTGKNSPFTEALVAVIKKPGLDVFATFNNVGLTVKQATAGQQQPWLSTSPIEGQFFFSGEQASVHAPMGSDEASRVQAELSAAKAETERLKTDAAKTELERVKAEQARLRAEADAAKRQQQVAALTLSNAPDTAQRRKEADDMAKAAARRKDYGEALRWYRKAADLGDTFAMNAIGGFISSGWGAPKDFGEAMRWWRKAADLGDSNGLVNIGKLYALIPGGPTDYGEGMRWYRKAADLGNAEAMALIGVLYEAGDGVPIDYGEAMRWYQRAVDLGNTNAMNAVGNLYEKGRGVPQEYAQAMKWYRKAADQGDLNGQLNVGWMYEQGLGIAKDFNQARYWYGLAAQRGYPPAQAGLARLSNQ